MHNAFLNIDNRKMSKSLRQFLHCQEIGEKYDFIVLRFFMLERSLQKPVEFQRGADGSFKGMV